MADDLGLGFDTAAVMQGATETMSMVFTGIIIGVFILILAALAFFLYDYQRKNIKFRIRQVTGSGSCKIIDTRAFEKKDADGNLVWKLVHKGYELPVPPEDAVHLDMKGKKVVEAYLFGTGQFVYTADRPKTRIIPQDIFNITDKVRRSELMREWIAEHQVSYPLEPFTTNQRSILINQIHKAQTRKRFKWQDHIPTMVSVTAMVMIVFGLMIFWGDIAKPALESKEMSREIVGMMKQIQETNLQIKNDVQVISTTSDAGRPTG